MKRGGFFGQYQYTGSILHRIDPRIKILSIFYLIIFLFFIKSIIGYLLVFAFALSLIAVSKVRLLSAFRSLRPILFLLLFTVFFQLLFTPGRILFRFYFLKVTEEGVNLAIYISLRLMLLSFFTFLLTATTSNIEIADGFQKLMAPLRVFRFPADNVALMISISIQFVPILFDEADRIMKAQISRGAEFNRGGVIKRARSFLPIVLPLLLNAFNRADQLAIAMESRGFVVGGKRTSYKLMRIGKKDVCFIISITIASILILFGERFL